MPMAIFDEGWRCRAANPAFASMTGTTERQCIGKTMDEIVGVAVPQFETALQRVWQSQECLWEQTISTKASIGRRSKHWLVDFFPIFQDSGAVHMVGAAFSKVTASIEIQGRLLRMAGLSARNSANGRSQSLRSRSAIPAGYIESMEKTVALLCRSMALRRIVSEMRVATSLHETVAQQAADDLRTALNLLEKLQSVRATVSHDPRAASPAESLTGFNRPSPRELQVLRFLADGKSNKEMASALRLSIRTVETYRARLMSKLKVHSAAEIVRCAIRNHFIQA